MEWFSLPFKIKAKESKTNKGFTNFYFVREREYVDKNGDTKKADEWIKVPFEIFENFEVGDKVQLDRVDFWNNKTHYDFISECNPYK